jgi:uncharacterized damage-inducible protein DinB
MLDVIKPLFERDLDALVKELNAYSNENLIWLKQNKVNNSSGTLCLHLCGNLQHFIGAQLGATGYVRNRKEEFDLQCSREELIQEIGKTKAIVLDTLGKLNPEILNDEYPQNVFGHSMTVAYFLTHLHGHLTYHLGQISYHRRLLDLA